MASELNRAAAIPEVPYGGSVYKDVNVFAAKGMTLTKKKFTIRITSTMDKVMYVPLFAGNAVGDDYLFDGDFTKPITRDVGRTFIAEGTGDAGTEFVRVESLSKRSLGNFQKWIDNGSLQWTEGQIITQNNKLQANQTITYRQYDGSLTPEDVEINPQALLSGQTFDASLTGAFDIPGNCFLSADTVLMYPILPPVAPATENVVELSFYYENYMSLAQMVRILATKQQEM